LNDFPTANPSQKVIEQYSTHRKGYTEKEHSVGYRKGGKEIPSGTGKGEPRVIASPHRDNVF
jgi:hypothetical protein